MYSLKTLYELRKSNSLNSRKSVGRIFYFQGLPGLSDISAILWPIFLENSYFSCDDKLPKSGDVILFSGDFFPENIENLDQLKYNDRNFKLVIKNIYDLTKNYEPWKSKYVFDPMANLENICLKSLIHTCLYEAPGKYHAKTISDKEKCIKKTKDFFLHRDFLHMETPQLVPSGGCETYLNSFSTSYTSHRGQQITLQLPTSPEFSLKKLIAMGYDKIFEISRSFRNHGELSQWHQPEFTMLEWYAVGYTLNDILGMTKDLVEYLAKQIGSSFPLPENWPTYSVDELFHSILNLSLKDVQDTENFYLKAIELSPSIRMSDTWDDIFCKLFMEKIEPFLKQQKACFVTHYPKQMGALARPSQQDHVVERAEAYLNGIEICNAYLELVDNNIFQERILEAENKNHKIIRDVLFENTMAFGMPPCAGNALGLDRVIAILIEANGIKDLFSLPFESRIPELTLDLS